MGAWLKRGRREGRRGSCMLSAIIEVRNFVGYVDDTEHNRGQSWY